MSLDPHPIYNALIRELTVADGDDGALDLGSDMPGAPVSAADRVGDAPETE